MKSIRHSASILILSLTAAVAGHAVAAEPSAGLTRAQVQADLAEAQRTGNIVEGEFSQPRNVLHPQQYPAQPKAEGKTRAQVIAELEQARASGELTYLEDTGMQLNTLPNSQGKGLTRAEVVADMQKARAAGQMQIGEGS
ncbi:hypothetical protein D3C72_1827940 [compost metagenome]